MFNVVHGDKVAVDALLEHPDVAAVSFVGSTPIARYIYETGTKHGKRVQALGGAKNHMIVLPDADIDMAADAAVSAAYGSAGERCMAVSVRRRGRRRRRPARRGDQGAAAEGEGRQRPRARPRRWGRSSRASTATRSRRYIESGAAQGATVVADGRETAPEGDGFFLGVSLLDNVTPEMDAYRDEIFGPVLSVVRVDTYDEALGLVNDNPYGNGVAIFTRDGGVARQFQFEVERGHGRDQRADPGAGRLLLVRRLEGVALRRLPRLRARVDPLLHARQGRHEPLARPGHEQGRPGVPADPLSPANRLPGGRMTGCSADVHNPRLPAGVGPAAPPRPRLS